MLLIVLCIASVTDLCFWVFSSDLVACLVSCVLWFVGCYSCLIADLRVFDY